MRTTALADPFTKVFCLRIVPRYGSPPIYLTSYPQSLYVRDPGAGYTVTEYRSKEGTENSDYDMSQSFTPAVIEIKGVFGEYGITRENILRGVFEGARAYCFATSWKAPIKDEEPIGTFIFGKPKITDNTFSLELHHIIDSFNAAPSLSYSKNCVNTFGDMTPDGEDVPLSFCRVGSAANYVSGTITAFDIETPNQFADSSRTEIGDWFGAGYVQFELPGGLLTKPFEVAEFNAGGAFTLFDTPLYTLTEGMNYFARAGCKKRLIDCRVKFNNVLGEYGTEGGFFGFTNIPTNQQSGKVGGFS